MSFVMPTKKPPVKLTPTERNERIDLIIGSIDFLIENPDKQCQRTLAISPYTGSYTAPDDPDACKWCITGRIARDMDIHPAPFAPVAVRNSAFIDEMRDYVEPLGFTLGLFFNHNDRRRGDEERTDELRLLRAVVGRARTKGGVRA